MISPRHRDRHNSIQLQHSCARVQQKTPSDLGAFAHIEWLQRAGIREGAVRTPALPDASL